jgi:hypothetical protein
MVLMAVGASHERVDLKAKYHIAAEPVKALGPIEVEHVGVREYGQHRTELGTGPSGLGLHVGFAQPLTGVVTEQNENVSKYAFGLFIAWKAGKCPTQTHDVRP